MLWAKAVLVGGLILLLLGFGLGIERTSATVNGHIHGCGSPIPQSWLEPGAASRSRPVVTDRQRRVEVACQSTLRGARLQAWGALGLGGLLFVAGWTALRERGEGVPVAV